MTKMLKMAVIAAALALGVSAVGAAVTINHAGPTPLTCTLTGAGMITSPAGDITVNCAEDLTTSGGGTCTNQRPTISVSSPPASATVGTQVTATFSASDPDGQPLNVTPNVGTVDLAASTWTWTPDTAGTKTVALTASDGQTCNAAATATFSVNVTSTSGGGTGIKAELLTPLTGREVLPTSRAIGSLETKYYYFVLPGPEAGGKSSYYVQVSLGTLDWGTNQDMVVKMGEPPTAADITAGVRIKTQTDFSPEPVWYKIASGECAAYGAGVGGSNERVYITSAKPGTYYVMVTNTCSYAGKFTLYYSAQ